MRRWRQRHPDEKRAQRRAEYARDPKRFQAAVDRSPNRAQVRFAMRQRRRARLANTGGSFTISEWSAVVLAFQGRCAYCGKARPLEPDHRVALARGGSNEIENILPACGRCNRRKHAMSESEFRARLAAEKKGTSSYN
jgi:5-methylcytosine-specific restriction endonuclease McrA